MRLLPIRALLPLINSARNSPAACSNIEFASLELQCFWVVSKNDRGKLCAKFVWGGLDVASRSSASSCRRPPAPRPGLQVLPARFAPAVPGVLLCWLARSLPCVRYKTLPAGFLVVRTVQNSPCMRRLRQIGPFRVSRESFIPEMRRGRACRESFVPHMRCEGVCWESFVPEVGPCGSCWARFVSPWHLPRVQLPGFHHPPVPHPGPPAPAARATLVAVGVLRHAKPSGGVSPACRTLAWRNSPRLVAARPWFAVVWRPNRRPPR